MMGPINPGAVVKVQGGGYIVASRTHPGAFWLVWGKDCSCPATVARCFHIQQVAAFCRGEDAAHKRPVAPPATNLMVD